MIFEKTNLARSRAEKINPAGVAGDLFPVTMGNYLPEETSEKFNFLMDLLDSINCYRVYFGTDMENFARCIENIIGEGK